MNIVGDQAEWTCYRIHVYTRHREIGVMGVRRRFLPPLLDTYQDMIFVLYGKVSSKLVTEPDFMDTLESVVCAQLAVVQFSQRCIGIDLTSLSAVVCIYCDPGGHVISNFSCAANTHHGHLPWRYQA